jgi:ATP-binding cassette subfamily C protein
MAKKTETGTEPKPVLWHAALKACRKMFAAAALFSLGLNLLYLAPSIFLIQIYDRVIPTQSLETLLLLVFVLLFALVTLGTLDWARARILTRVGASLDQQLAPDLLRHTLSSSNPGANGRRSQAMREFDVLRSALSGPALMAALDLPWAPVFLLVLALIHPTIALVAVGGIVILLGLSIANDRAVRDPIARASGAALASYALIEHSAAAADAVRGLGMREALTVKHARERAEAADLQTDANLTSSYFNSSIRVARFALQNLVLAWGAYLVIDGQITAGAMFAASILCARALQPIEQLTGAWRSIVQGRSAYDALKSLLTSSARPETTALPAPRARLTFENVYLARPGGGDPILRGVSFGLSPGETVGIVGPSGSGKTTIARLAVGALPVDGGAVRIDGSEPKQWDPDALGAHIGYLPQNLNLLAGTIADNISRFRRHLEPEGAGWSEAVIAAARAADAHETIVRLPKGYDTEIGPSGAGLSGGQAQRVALARALYAQPPILILDEPNSFLDSEGEQALLRALHRHKSAGGASIIIAHRGGVMAHCDRLIVLRDGRVELMGPREEIMMRLAEHAQRSSGGAVVGSVAGGGRP